MCTKREALRQKPDPVLSPEVACGEAEQTDTIENFIIRS